MTTALRPTPAATVLIVTTDGSLASRLGGVLLSAGFSVSWETTPALAAGRLRLAAGPELLLVDVPTGCLETFAPLWASRMPTTLLLVDPLDLESGRQGAFRLERGVADKAIVERLQFLRLKISAPDGGSMVRIGRLCLDPASRVATCGPRTIPLTWSEFDLLWILSVNAGRVVPRVDLHQVVTGTPYDAATRSIDVHVSRLRRKLETAGFTQATVTAVRFQGYVLLPG